MFSKDSNKIRLLRQRARKGIKQQIKPATLPSGTPEWAALIIEGIEEVLFSIDKEWRFTYLNHQASVVFGQPRETLVGKVMWEAFPTLIGSPFEQLYRQTMADGIPRYVEDFSPTRRAWYEVRAYPISQGLIVYFQDITLRKRVEAENQRQTERASIQAKLSRALAEVTQDYNNTLETAARQLTELVGDNCSIRLISRDGDWFELGAVYDTDPEVAAFMRDALAVRNQRVTEGFSGRVVQTGEPMLLPGLSLEQLKAMTPPEMWTFVNRLQMSSTLLVPLRAVGRVIGVVGMARRASDNPYTEADLTLLVDLADRVALAIANAQLLQQTQSELLERTRLEAQLVQSQKMESIGRLAGGIAHDFNNVLTAIIGYSELMLLSLSTTDPSYADATEIQRAAQRAAALTHQLLAFSRKQVLTLQVFNLNDAVQAMDTLLHRVLGEDIDLVSLIEPELGHVLADRHQVEQVILNLAINARDAMPHGGQLTIETAHVELDEAYHAAGHPEVKTGHYVMLAVSDTGAGMDQVTQAQMFEPFFTTKEQGKGTGLGLATVYGIVQQSEGYIWVHSEVGIGTTLKIYLPKVDPVTSTTLLAAPDTHQQGAAIHRTRAGVQRSWVILVIEDDILVSEVIHRVLRQAGYITLNAHNGQEALNLLASHPAQIDVALVNMVVPDISVHDILQQLRHKHVSLKVVCMSGYTDRVVAQHNKLDPCDAFLQKPFTPSTLLQRVDAVLASAS